MGDQLQAVESRLLFRCESVALRTYWVLVVMDQYTRRIIGFGIQASVDGLVRHRHVASVVASDTLDADILLK